MHDREDVDDVELGPAEVRETLGLAPVQPPVQDRERPRRLVVVVVVLKLRIREIDRVRHEDHILRDDSSAPTPFGDAFALGAREIALDGVEDRGADARVVRMPDLLASSR